MNSFRINNFKLNKRSILFLLIVVLTVYTVSVLFLAVFYLRRLQRESALGEYIDNDYESLWKHVKERRPQHFNVLNGETALDSTSAVVTLPFAVVIDNHSRSRPQFGLGRADVVFELPVEGGMTRFLAFFVPDELISTIGPVRSARIYFIDYAQELGSLFVHSGGSPQALQELKSGSFSIIDIDEIGPDGIFFWRDRSLVEPHNLFTSSGLLWRSTLKEGSVPLVLYDDVSWKWKSGEKDDEEPSKVNYVLPWSKNSEGISIYYSTEAYHVAYVYDPQNDAYMRFQGGAPHVTAEGDKIVVDNVLIAFMRISVIDKEGRLRIDNRGRGEAVICTLGQCRKGAWEKQDAKKRMTFYLGEEKAVLKPGKTWIQVVPEGRRVEYSSLFSPAE